MYNVILNIILIIIQTNMPSFKALFTLIPIKSMDHQIILFIVFYVHYGGCIKALSLAWLMCPSNSKTFY